MSTTASTQAKADIAYCEVTVTVAVSESGRQECCVAGSHWIQQRRKHEQFMADLRADKQLWSVKTVRVQVPMPVQFDDMGTGGGE